MGEILLKFNWISCLLVALVCVFVSTDKAFSKRIRLEFQFALGLCFLLSLLAQHLQLVNALEDGFTTYFVHVFEGTFRPLVLLLLILASDYWKQNHKLVLAGIYLVNIIFVALNFRNGLITIFAIYFVILVLTVFLKVKEGDITDRIFVILIAAMAISSIATELIAENKNVVNGCLCVISSIYYCYWVMRTYKKDNLTRLLIRHNLNYEMADLINKAYDIVLIDVDNFKLINDKYGHDRGDEALVTIVEAVKKFLPKGATMYRFGGDEFVIISKKVKTDVLVGCLAMANEELRNSDLHISYGIVRHEAGTPSEVSLAKADLVMYENKRSLKAQDIWDDMTGLYNYRGFVDELDTFRKKVEKDYHCTYLVCFDVDHLNNVNMAYGHAEGNLIIVTLARIIKKYLRGRDFIGHLGSDEYAVAIECYGPDDEFVDAFITSVQTGMDTAYEFADKDYSVTLNVAKLFIDMDNKLSAEENVNDVLYIKQEDKENRRKTDAEKDQDYDPEEEKLVLDILDNNKLCYAFQPIISAKSGMIVAYETLMRSNTDVMVSPLKILKYADRNNRTYDIEKLTFYNVLNRVRNDSTVPGDKHIFINSIPGFFLTDEDYSFLQENYSDILEKLVVEITEQREMEENDLVELNRRRDKSKFNLAIDDYGSGCSNTNSLLRYMPKVVKLDRLLITAIDKNSKKQFFVNSIVSFAKENDMLILAEGVETESELKTVIRLGVDLIQGYIAAKPSVEIITDIPEDIKKIIVEENLKVGGNQRRVYTASSNTELSVVKLAMEDYSKIVVASEYLTLTGSTEYTADMVIKIKDNTNCEVTLSDVRLNSVDDEPCILVGENSNLVLRLEGKNRINAKGIRVPESSSLVLKGTGSLDMYVKGHQCYAIGGDTESTFGSITLGCSGEISINVDGEECVGIGGGVKGENSSVSIVAGSYKFNIAGVDAVGIGNYEGEIPIVVKDCLIAANFRVNVGTFVGTLHGIQNVEIKNFILELTGSGTNLAAVGSIDKTAGKISMHAGTYNVKMNGHNIYILGCNEGEVNIDVSHTRLDLIGEGDNVLGFGSMNSQACVSIHECSMEMIINASNPLAFGIKVNQIKFGGELAVVKVNGVLLDTNNI